MNKKISNKKLFVILLVSIFLISCIFFTKDRTLKESSEFEEVYQKKKLHDNDTLSLETTKKLNQVKVAVLYQRINDNKPPDRTLEDQVKIFKDINTDFIFRAWWRWRICPDSSKTAKEQLVQVGYPSMAVERVISEHYAYEYLKEGIEEIRKEIPDVIICGAIPAQIIDSKIWDEVTGEVIPTEKVREMAFDPNKFGIKVSFEEAQKKLAGGAGFIYPEAYYPDITNEDFQELMLGWAKRQIDCGVDAIWIDALFSQARGLYLYTKDLDHPAVKKSYEGACEVVRKIHQYGISKGKYIYVGTWASFVEFSYEPCDIDFVTISPTYKEIENKKLDEKYWDDTITKIRTKLPNTTIFAFIDWGSAENSPIISFSQKLTPNEQKEMLRYMDNYFTKKNVIFIYPIHGGYLGKSVKKSYGKYIHYDSLAPEFYIYDTIKELALNKTKS